MLLSQDAIFIKGDTIELQFQLFKDKSNNVKWNLLNHEIRFQLDTSVKIYKATANVSGGSDEQISLVDAVNGIFLVTITHTETTAIDPADYTYEIQVTTPTPDSKKYTVLQSSLRILNEAITWEAKP
jgi:hypothetical protein